MLTSSGKPKEEVARKPGKKKKEVQTNRQELREGMLKVGEEKVRSLIRTF